MVTDLLRSHDLPPRWDGHPIDWTGWQSPTRSSAAYHAPPDACESCGIEDSQPKMNIGTIRDVSGGGKLVAFRCSECGNDVVWDWSTNAWWDLDPTDYSDEGSYERGPGEVELLVEEISTAVTTHVRQPAFRAPSPIPQPPPPGTYGWLRWESNVWVLETVPSVAMRIKRIFPRVEQKASSEIWIRDTAEVARDLEWLMERHPLAAEPDVLARLKDRAGQHRETEQTRIKILKGEHQLDLKEPARAPRPYQLQAADLCLATGQLLLADDLGLGKSFSGLLVLRDPDALPALVVTMTHLPRQWARELDASLPWLSSHIVKGTTPYDIDADVIIISYSKLAGWGDHLAGAVRTVIFDEVQELRRRESLKYIAAQQIAGRADWRIGLSATPVYNYGGEIHSIMQVLAPDALGTRQEFMREWGGSEMSGDNVKLSNPRALGSWLREEGLLLRRTREEVGLQLPKALPIVHEVDTDPKALEAVAGDVRALAELIRTSTGKEKFKASGDLDWKLRQATGVAKARYVAEFVKLILESEDKVVVFGWHRAVYDIWLEELAAYHPVLYTGSETARQKQASEDAFLTGDARVLLMSLRAGAGLDGLQEAASVLVFGELDWSPGIHDQCIGRLRRDGADEEEPVVAYYLVSDEGSDPVIAEVLELKRQQAEPIRNPDQPLLAPISGDGDRIQRLVEAVLKENPS